MSRRTSVPAARRRWSLRAVPAVAAALAVSGGFTGAVTPAASAAGPTAGSEGPLVEAGSALATSGQISPQLLASFETASRRTGVPWAVLAGLAWQQTRDGAQAPGETGDRSATPGSVAERTELAADITSDRPAPAQTTAGMTLSWAPATTSTYPRLVPAITNPGYGMWLLTGPRILRTDPQDVPTSVMGMARLMAADIKAGQSGVPTHVLLGPGATFGAQARQGWARILEQLPIYHSGSADAFADSVLDQAVADQAPPPKGFDYAKGCPTEAGAIGNGVPGNVSILGPAEISQSQVLSWYNSERVYPATINGTPAAALIADYYQVGAAEGVRPDWAFTQAVLETGGFRSDDTAINNFAGIAHPDDASSGMTFPTVLAGVTAQVQLLKRVVLGNGVTLASAAAPGLPNWQGRTATTWAALAANWASSQVYGLSLAALHDDLTGDGCPLPVEPAPATTTTTTAPPAKAPAAPPPTAAPPPPAAAPPTTAKPTTTTAPAAPPTTVAPTGIAAVVAYAEAQEGKPYSDTGAGPTSWNLTNLAQAAFKAGGFTVPADAVGLAATGSNVADLSALAPGDLLFTGSTFVGIYVGSNRVVGSPDSAFIEGVPLSTWPSAELTARRVSSSATATTPSTPSAATSSTAAG